jgi:cellulose synthase/poly-beta-1,6-N-acetylglucosamine synthase-like glycosyltransferase
VYTASVILFWTSLAGLCFSYVGYPLLMYVAARCRRTSHRQPVEPTVEELPDVTVLIAAHNAEHHIHQRIHNILACDYPPDRLTIVVASDGSTDATVREVRRFDRAHVEAIPFRQRRGKVKTLADAMRQLRSEVIVFTDATSRFDRDSLRQLARHFVDPQIGLATGRAAIVDEQGTPSESIYWRSEMMVRRSEAQLGIMLGASGAIYAMRRRLFVEPPCPVINDDLVLPMLTHLRHGCGFVFDETARAYALSTGGLAGEFRRRARIGAGAFQCLPGLRELLQWRHAKQALAFGAHKLLRWICPFLLVALIVTNLSLAAAWYYQLFLYLQAIAYLLALVGLLVPQRGRVTRIAHIASSFLVMNLALLTGFFRWVFDPGNVVWNPTPRPTLEATSPVFRNL